MQFSSQMTSNCTKFIFSSPVLSLCHTCGVVQRPSVVVHRTSPLTTRNNCDSKSIFSAIAIMFLDFASYVLVAPPK